MEGYLRLRINPWVRRLLTRMVAIIPAVIVILINGEKNIDNLLVLSQVILSLQLGFAVIPLIHFVSNKKEMGDFAIKPLTQVAAWVITTVLVYLNIRMVAGQAIQFFSESENEVAKGVILLGSLLFLVLLVVALLYPIFKTKKQQVQIQMHPTETLEIGNAVKPIYDRIAVALDFSSKDPSVIAHALGQVHQNTTLILIHVVESASAKILGNQTDDLEARKDAEKLNHYVLQLKEKGIKAECLLGFRNRQKEIASLVKKSGAQLLVIGAHGHSGVKDWFYGETINAVRHRLKIPVLIVSV
jgi:manganese transport protein